MAQHREVASTQSDLAGLVEEFDALQREVFAYQYAQQVINYDGETVGPVEGVAARAEALASLAGKEHEAAYGDRARRIAGDLQARSSELDELHADELRVFSRDLDEMGKVPAQECADFARLTAEASSVWKRAKATSDYALFEPYVAQIVDHLVLQAHLLDPDRDPYEVWLDRFERGLTRSALDSFFEELRSGIVPVVNAIVEKGWQPDDSFLHTVVPVAAQRELCMGALRVMGLDMDALAVGETEHPFTDGFSHGDVRIANHYYEDSVASALFSAIHEGGHALYEQGVDPRYDFTCLRGGVSMGIHESQSRFMENIVARSEAFSGLLLPMLREAVPGVFDGVDAHALYAALCIARPSLIRTEADELTYPLHIMVRYEVESALFSGACSAHDAPELWNSLMEKYLGVSVPDDAHGILQDTHWANGTFAYFPSYAIGSAYAAQYLRAMRRDFDGAIASGDLARVNAWLSERIWRYGSSKDPSWLVQNACGEPFDPSCYVEYLTTKYRTLYAL